MSGPPPADWELGSDWEAKRRAELAAVEAMRAALNNAVVSRIDYVCFVSDRESPPAIGTIRLNAKAWSARIRFAFRLLTRGRLTIVIVKRGPAPADSAPRSIPAPE